LSVDQGVLDEVLHIRVSDTAGWLLLGSVCYLWLDGSEVEIGCQRLYGGLFGVLRFVHLCEQSVVGLVFMIVTCIHQKLI
jgi:hypothetical protein